MHILLFALSFIFFTSHSKSEIGNFTRQNESCIVYYNSATDKVSGNLYAGQLREKDRLIGSELCCLSQMEKGYFNFFSSKPKKLCCQQKENSRCYPGILKYRPCPRYTCWYPEETSKKDIEDYASNRFNTLKFCKNEKPSTIKKGRIIKSNLILYKDKQKCTDVNKKYHILSMKVAKHPQAYHYCCSVDITTNLEEDPTKVCCGLAGSQSRNYGGSRIGATYLIDQQTPPCCRKIQDHSTCQPKRDGKYFMCKPVAGSWFTKDLSENLPYYTPEYYRMLTQSNNIFACDPNHSSFFYEYPSLMHYYKVKGSPLAPAITGICCNKKDIFFYDTQTISNECCITYADPEYSPNKTYEYSIQEQMFDYNCSMTRKTFIENGEFIYRPCLPDACIKKNWKMGILNRYNITKLFVIPTSNVEPLYGVYDYEANKYV